ncbi:MAG: hypothetical protein AAB887_01135 [Patescibacteria group bacterium]
MKKFLPTLLLLILLPAIALATAGSALAATADCTNYAQYGFKDEASCVFAVGSCAITGPYLNLFPDELACVQFLGSMDTLFANQVDGPWYNQNPTQFAAKVTGGDQNEIFGERYTFAQINWIINSISTMINPTSGIENPLQLLDFFNVINDILGIAQSGQTPTLADYSKLGPAGLLAGGVSTLYSNPPVSGVNEIKYMASRILDISTGVQPAYAQGYGFSGLGGNNTNSAVRALWTATRNMSYLIMVILLVASGFLIMFRVKINPQTVVSLQTMIPKLIITMLLVTFSFAIAGLVIDLVYVVVVAITGFLSLGGIINNSDLPNAINNLLNTSFSQYMAMQMLGPILTVLGLTAIISLILFPVAGVVIVIGVIFAIIVAIIFLITLWKIFWMMVKAYVMLTLQIIIAPLQIMLDLIPGQQGFGPWLRNLIANASVFATIPIMLVIQNILSGNWFTNTFYLHLNTFNTFGGTQLNLPFMGAETGTFISLAMGFVIFTLTPKIADMIRDALKIPAFKYGGAIGEALTGPLAFGLRSVNVATDVGKAWTTRLGTRVPGAPAAATQSPRGQMPDTPPTVGE